ncbi:MAG: hypothetical protein QNK38_02215 [Nitrospirota bacterium]|nr:hypothetical protein [Nitrospirota bacterium]
MKVNAKLEVLGGMRSTCMALALILFATVKAYGILPHPDKEQVDHAVKKGMDFAQQPDLPMNCIGILVQRKNLNPKGFW